MSLRIRSCNSFRLFLEGSLISSLKMIFRLVILIALHVGSVVCCMYCASTSEKSVLSIKSHLLYDMFIKLISSWNQFKGQCHDKSMALIIVERRLWELKFKKFNKLHIIVIILVQEPGSFSQSIHYRADMVVMEVLINRSQDCSQQLTYHCRGARLLDQGI